jgi:hypothetical protein
VHGITLYRAHVEWYTKNGDVEWLLRIETLVVLQVGKGADTRKREIGQGAVLGA